MNKFLPSILLRVWYVADYDHEKGEFDFHISGEGEPFLLLMDE